MSKRQRRIKKEESTESSTLPTSKSEHKLAQSHSFAHEPSNKDLLLCYYRNAFTSLLGAVGLNPAQIEQAKSSIDQIMTQAQHGRLGHQVNLTKSSRSKIQEFHKSTTNLLNSQIRVVAATTIQSQVRGWLVRKKLAILSKEDRNAIRLQNVKLNQLILLEKDYITTFQQITQQYIHPLRANPIKGIVDSSLQYLFCNIEQLVPVHEKLVGQLETILNTCDPLHFTVGQVFLQAISVMVPAYSKYASNHQASLDTLSYLCQNVSRFQTFLDETHPGGSNKFKEYLAFPIDHFSTLATKLTGLRACYIRSNKDYSLLDQATEALGAGGDLIQMLISQNKLPAQQKAIKQLLAVEWQVESPDRALQLLNWPKRKLLKEGPVRLRTHGKKLPFHLHLFTDLLLITEKLVTNYKFVRLISNHQIQSMDDSKEPELFIKLTQIDSEPLDMIFKTKQERNEWAQHFASILDLLLENRVFGVPLETIIRRESSPNRVPIIMTKALKWLRSNAQQTEGVFRVPGDSAQIGFMLRLIDLGFEREVDFRVCSVHDVAGLVKLYLRELPEPLIPFALYANVIETQQKLEKTSDEKAYQRDLILVLHQLPKNNSLVLGYLLKFLHQFSEFAVETKMTIANLAMVFSPNIIRPQVDTVDTAMESFNVTKATETMITHHRLFWKALKSLSTKEDSPRSLSVRLEGLLENPEKLLAPKRSSSTNDSPSPNRAVRRQQSEIRVRRTISIEATSNASSRKRSGSKRLPRDKAPQAPPTVSKLQLPS